MADPIHIEAREAFYGAALIGLRALDSRERSPRRFGPDAEARWEQFRGALGPSDRLDLLLRDAAVTWAVAFSPAEAFGIPGLTEDEPFGPDWRGITDDKARRLLTDSSTADLDAAARALGITPAPVEIPPLSASTRLIVAGGAAILALAQRFAAAPDLSWADQVLVVATSPQSRQLAGLAAVVLNARERARVVRPDADAAAVLKAAKFPSPDAALVSSDAEPACAVFARQVAGAR